MAVKQIFDSFIPSESVISMEAKEGGRKKKKRERAVTSMVSHRVRRKMGEVEEKS